MDEDKKTPDGNPFFLFLAALMVAGTVATYLYKDEMAERFAGPLENAAAGELMIASTLVILVLLAIFLIWCYRNPAFVDRLAGRRQGLPTDEKSGFKYSGGGFQAESAGHEKKMNTRRKSARALRKQMAARQREIDAAEASDEDNT